MVRVLPLSVVLHVAALVALLRGTPAPVTPSHAVVEVSIEPTPAAPAPPPLPKRGPAPPPSPQPAPASRPSARANAPSSMPSASRRAAPPVPDATAVPRETPIPRAPSPVASAPPDAASITPLGSVAREPPGASHPPSRVDLFAASSLTKAANIDPLSAPTDRSFRPRRGVGGDSASGGTDIGSFLAEDAARMRVDKGNFDPELRRIERRMNEVFQPTFVQADNSNRAEMFFKQFRGFLKNPPKTGELARTIDPTKETLVEKLRSARPDKAFFLGRRIEIFVRQAPDGSIKEIAVRQASGYKAYDEMAMAAVEKAIAGRLPSGADKTRDVRTLWQLDATAYVVISPQPELHFDEATGKSDWVYPLQKRIDKAVSLIAVY